MVDNLKEAIQNFCSNSCDKTANNMHKILWDAIVEAVKGQTRSKVFGITFCLVYRDPSTTNNIAYNIADNIANEVECFGQKKDFHEALIELFKTIRTNIEKDHKDTITALSGSDITSRVKWIRNTLGLVLRNKIFEDEINQYSKMNNTVKKKMRAWEETDEWKSCPESDKKELKAKKEEEFRNQCIKANRNIPLEQSKEGEEGSYQINALDKEAVLEFWQEYYNNNKGTIDPIQWQKKAFFWKPNEELENIFRTGEKPERAIYIAFFYSWLRQCSYATCNEIGYEIGVNISTVTRWKPHPNLVKFFPIIYNFFYPVCFENEAIDSIGMRDPTVRCYTKKVYEGEDYEPILCRKKILWEIYILLLDKVKIDDLKINYDTIDNVSDNFSLEIVLNKDIDSNRHKSPLSSMVCVKTINTK